MSNYFSRHVNHKPHTYFETINSLDSLTETFRGTYLKIRDKWGYNARISEIIRMIQFSYGIEEWDLVDFKQMNNSEIESWLVDYMLEYRSDKPIDFGEIWEKLKKVLSFTGRELDLIETGAIDERLWAIFTVITEPNLNIKYIINQNKND